MYIENGIAYAGEKQQELKVVGVQALDDYRLWVHFSDGTARVFDVQPLIEKYPLFKSLQDEQLFKKVYIDYGTVVWQNGDIDIETEMLYRKGVIVYPEREYDKVIVAEN